MNLESLPLFSEMTADQRAAVEALARARPAASGEVLFYEGDTAEEIILLTAGRVTLTHAGQPAGTAGPGQLLDMSAALGGLAHHVKATAAQPCELLCWPASEVWPVPGFQEAARRMLGWSLRQSEARLAEVSAPIHFDDAARIAAGPFVFDDVTLLIAFCDAERDVIAQVVPDGLSLLAPQGGDRAPIFVGLAEFPDAHPENNPQARFAYTETTFFVPVRCGLNPGVCTPYIYPSSWEPILIGREVYGFPKRLGHTEIGTGSACLSVDGEAYLRLDWNGLEASDEPRLVGALMAWLGLDRHAAAAAFQIGDGLRAAMNLPPYRRVDVYNRKQILSAEPRLALDQLIHAVFGVRRWSGISRMVEPSLTISGGPLIGADLRLREAYRTRLDMRLSASEIAEL